MTLSSHFIFPSSTKIASAALVKALLFEAIPKRVLASTFSCVAIDFTPYPFAKTTFPSLMIATAIPGTLNAVKVRLTNKSTSGAVICANEIVVAIKVMAKNNLFFILLWFRKWLF